MKFLAFLRDSYREAVDGFVIYVMLGLSALVIVLAASLSFAPAEPTKAFPDIVKKFALAFRDRGASNEPVGYRLGSGLATQYIGLPTEYTAAEVQRMDAGTGSAGTFKLRLTVKPGRLQRPRGPGGPGDAGDDVMAAMLERSDWFRFTVAAWAQNPYREDTVEIDPRTGELVGLNGGLFGQPKKDDKDKKDKDGKDKDGEKGKGKDGPRAAPGQVFKVSSPQVSEAEKKAVTDEMMADFIKNQFALHSGLDDVSVKRLTGVAEPQYLFEVEVKGGSSARGWPYTTKALFGAFTLSDGPLGDGLLLVQDSLVNGVGAVITLLVTIILTAFFIPNLMRKGSLDLLLSKPVGRGELLVYKYIGGLTFMFLVSCIAVGGVWLVMSARSGYWSPTFLLSIPMLTFSFAILYAFSALLGVLTRNAIVAILLTILFMFLLWAVGTGKTVLDVYRSAPVQEDGGVPKWLEVTVDGANAVLPRYKDLDKLLSRMLAEGVQSPAELKARDRLDLPSWGSAIGVSLAFIALMLLLAYWRFATRDG